jgi:hypothetical protein
MDTLLNEYVDSVHVNITFTKRVYVDSVHVNIALLNRYVDSVHVNITLLNGYVDSFHVNYLHGHNRHTRLVR